MEKWKYGVYKVINKKFISEIESELNIFSEKEKIFYNEVINWIHMALKYTSIIVVEGNQ